MIEPREKQIHIGIVQALTLLAAPNCLWWHYPANRLSARDGGYWKRLGLRSGVPDFQIIVPGLVCFLEVKSPRGRLSAEQKAMQVALQTLGCSYAVVRSVHEAIQVLTQWGALRDIVEAA